jgi:DNA (cytosine-5)-methyltransferase 1
MGDPRCWPPGHKVNADDRARLGTDEADARYGDRAGTHAIRISIRDALILQSFRPDYPVQGAKTKQFEQVGNAVPPLLAAHVLSAVTGHRREEAA